MGDHLPLPGGEPAHETDVLTGLPGARSWPHLVAEHRRVNPDKSWIAALRLDGFHAYATEHGGLQADLLLVDVATAWESVLRGGDVLVRFEAADFGCVVRAVELNSAFAVVGRLRTQLPPGVTCSASIAHPLAGETVRAATDRARDGLRESAERGGANRIAVLLPGTMAA